LPACSDLSAKGRGFGWQVNSILKRKKLICQGKVFAFVERKNPVNYPKALFTTQKSKFNNRFVERRAQKIVCKSYEKQSDMASAKKCSKVVSTRRFLSVCLKLMIMGTYDETLHPEFPGLKNGVGNSMKSRLSVQTFLYFINFTNFINFIN
jgi:hypothetical protein